MDWNRPASPAADEAERLAPEAFKGRLDAVTRDVDEGVLTQEEGEARLGPDYAVVATFAGPEGFSWLACRNHRDARMRRQRVLLAHARRWELRSGEAPAVEGQAGPPPVTFLPPEDFRRALQKLVYEAGPASTREEVAAARLGPAWAAWVQPLTLGQDMRYFDDVSPGERSTRLRRMAANYDEAWEKSPGSPRPVVPGAPSLGVEPAAYVPSRKPDLPPPGPAQTPTEVPWPTSDRLTCLVQDVVDAGLEGEGEARAALGSWAMTGLLAVASWPAWVAAAKADTAHGLGLDAYRWLSLDVARARRHEEGPALGALPDGPAAWADRLREDLALPGNTVLYTQRLAQTPLLPADYAEALAATKTAIAAGRLDAQRAGPYLIGCLVRRAR